MSGVVSGIGNAAKRQHKLVRDRYRNAVLIHRVIAKQPPFTAIAKINSGDVDRLVRQRRIAATNSWLNAQAKIESRLRIELESVRTRIDQASELLGQSPSVRQIAIRDLICDLAALEADFNTVAMDGKRKTLSVTTEPIELDDVFLGPFEIRLQLPYISESHAYSVIAKDPHPAATSESTTHPHVCDERLCEGEGHAAIRRALGEGRLYDFFVIVRQVLGTYNPGSAYISLSDWHGVECRDCGDTVDSSDSDCCSRCEGRTCRDCSVTCDGCYEVFCDDCTACCEGCDSHYCSGCLEPCDGCHNQFCKACLEEGRCDDCLEKETEESETQTTIPAETAVHADGVGEAEVPA